MATNPREAKYVSSSKSSTVITGGKGNPEQISERIQTIKNQLEDVDQNFDKEKLRERLGKLASAIAVIKVGGATDIEMRERKERVLDAKEATLAAIKAGVVQGGETVYLKIRKVLKKNKDDFAQRILYNALEAPFNKLLTNAGMDPGEWKEKMANSVAIDNVGVNVVAKNLDDMIKVGIIDPVLVPKMALRNAISVAIQLMTTGAIIVPIKEDKK